MQVVERRRERKLRTLNAHSPPRFGPNAPFLCIGLRLNGPRRLRFRIPLSKLVLHTEVNDVAPKFHQIVAVEEIVGRRVKQ